VHLTNCIAYIKPVIQRYQDGSSWDCVYLYFIITLLCMFKGTT